MSVPEVALSRRLPPLQIPGLRYIPGLALLAAVGYAGKVVSSFVPHTEYVLFAIAIGMVIGNTVRLPAWVLAGVNTYELWLKTGIVLMGATLALQSVAKIGGVGIALVLVEILISIVVARFLARVFGLTDKLGSLIGVGIGICGVSAIIGATGAIKAEEEDQSYAIATILLFGAVMLFVFPLLGHIFGMSDKIFGFWTGLAIDNTAETIATGMAYSDAAGKLATIVKLSRNALMGLVILGFGLYYARQGLAPEIKNKGKFVWDRFPKFLLGFLFMSLLATLGFFSPGEVKALTALSKWFFVLTFAGVGFATQFRRMRAGIKPFLVGFGAEAVVTVLTLGMVLLVANWL
ncbi:MAG: YeiH family protein [Symbiobacteriia bacterium]